MGLTLDEFTFVSNLVKKKSGIHLLQDKTYLVESRLMPLAKKFSCADVSELVQKMQSTNDEEMISVAIEAMTTNESLFFRDVKPFEQFKKVMMPRLFEKNPEQVNFKIWSAACSTGQEPYSLAMTILENAEWAHKYKFEIVASDLSSKVLEKAVSGCYSQFEVQRGVPISLLLKYFKQNGEDWHINDKVKEMVKFHKQNLIESFIGLGSFDLILCRNVLIYFETETVVKILHQFSKVLNPNGILVIGGSECITGNELYSVLENCPYAYVLDKK